MTATVTAPWRGLIDAYRAWLPVAETATPVTLHEGNTPLLPAPHLSELTGCDIWLKVEGANPTGSFKDRGMTVAVTNAAAAGAKTVVCASTGNTSASAAAYAARAGLGCAVLVPRGAVAAGKLAQTARYGATLVEVDGLFDDCLRVARELAAHHPVTLVNSVRNEDRLSGQRTAAFEVVDALGEAPDIHALPVGNAGNITAIWQGYERYAEAGLAARRPRMWGFQAAGAAPLVHGTVIAEPRTIASAIRVGDPATREGAVDARDRSGGLIDAVTDEQILAAWRLLGEREGVFVEPASASGVAGLLAAAADGRLDPGQRVVATVTGNGLKDPETAASAGLDPVPSEASTAQVARLLGV
ncbi:threonine synthase [Mangrovactinospora gilvigrisea]|uniref:Threonine synthase n=1 Tax=Mangrovactinospora gilvigrisea TaxID=1428644 RepID=A0A1J7B9L0_9ACTN|nr:threonine synthase [Mangrovactinospora gilvigrisea]OIV35339.1 threonine synthase [Mangrovactinospora gilvigrisea]